MNVSNIYDRSIKLIDESYTRLLKIWQLPKGSISKKVINHRPYYYLQYRNGSKIHSHILNKDEVSKLRKDVNERKRLLKLNKSAKEEVNKNIKVLAIFDKGLSTSLMDEAFAYSFDEIPIDERKKVEMPFIEYIGSSSNAFKNSDTLKEYFEKWKIGEIRAREISNYIIRRISD